MTEPQVIELWPLRLRRTMLGTRVLPAPLRFCAIFDNQQRPDYQTDACAAHAIELER